MKAQQMFEKLGWEKQKERLAYWKTREYIGGKKMDYCIAFSIIIRQVHLYCVNNYGTKELYHDLDYINSLDMNELLSVVQQCVELGWLGTGKQNEADD